MRNSELGEGERLAALRGFWLPMLVQFGLLFLAIWLHGAFIGLGGAVPPAALLSGDAIEATAGRLGYMLFALCAGLALATLAARLSRRGGARGDAVGFWLGVASGTLLWQAIGEDAPNFGATVRGQFVRFPNPEATGALLPLICLTALLLIVRRANVPHGLRSAALCFYFNWLGHFMMLGLHPLVAARIPRRTWCILSGCLVGAALAAFGLRAGLRRGATPNQRRIASTIAYFGIGFAAMAFVEG